DRALESGIAVMWNVLTGVRILDLSRVFAGPAATQVLGDLGGDVIKVQAPAVLCALRADVSEAEAPGRGAEARYFGLSKETLDEHAGVSPSFVALNRNKRSIAIDLASPAGRRAVLRMAAAC